MEMSNNWVLVIIAWEHLFKTNVFNNNLYLVLIIHN